jgi:hypothetical protein
MRHEIITCDWCGQATSLIRQLRIEAKNHDMCSACLKMFAEKLEKSGVAVKEPLYPIGQLGVSDLQPATISWPGAVGNGQWQGNLSGSSLVLPSVTTTGTLIPSNYTQSNGITYYVAVGPVPTNTTT